jgi:hypothetical protein
LADERRGFVGVMNKKVLLYMAVNFIFFVQIYTSLSPKIRKAIELNIMLHTIFAMSKADFHLYMTIA